MKTLLKQSCLAALVTIFFFTTIYAVEFKNTQRRAVPIGDCGDPATPISIIQGAGDESPHVNMHAVIEAVVTAVAPELDGFFIQEEPEHQDRDARTSEGIFVYKGKMGITVEPGQLIRVTGKIGEYKDRTQLSTKRLAKFCQDMTAKPTVLKFSNPDIGFESYESMLVGTNQLMTVISTYNLSRYGELEISDQLLFNPTQLYLPGSKEAANLAEQNNKRRIILDDFQQGAPTTINLHGELNSKQSLRVGSAVTGIRGILDESFNAYRIRMLQKPFIEPAPRPQVPEVNGDLVIAAFNVLNLFNGDGTGGGFPTDRGAETIEEYQLQQDKIVKALFNLKADIIGLNEIENDGDEKENSAIAQLARALNFLMGSDIYGYLAYNPSLSGASIANGILYRKDKVTPEGELKVLSSENSAIDDLGPLFDTRKSRPAITQVFKDNASGNSFVVSVNHLKSKGSKCGENDDTREQGNCNRTRTRAAQGLSQWLDQEFTDLPIYIIGDMNSYAQEDPIQAFKKAGYRDVIRDKHGNNTYTFSFRGQLGSLDYVLANTEANQLIQSAFEWRINAAEPRILDYRNDLPNSDDKKPTGLISVDEFRSSDHDPVVFGISFK
jgi:predicted extracellular nuclease